MCAGTIFWLPGMRLGMWLLSVVGLIKTVSVQYRGKKKNIYFPFGIPLREFPKRITFDYHVLCRNAAAVSDGNRMMKTALGRERGAFIRHVV